MFEQFIGISSVAGRKGDPDAEVDHGLMATQIERFFKDHVASAQVRDESSTSSNLKSQWLTSFEQ